MVDRPMRRLRLATAAALVAVVGACSGPTQSSSPIRTGSAPSTAANSSPGTPTSTPSPSRPPDPPFVAANVRIDLQAYAKVEGGALAFAFPHDGSNRLLVATQEGRIWSIANGTVADHPMLDIAGRITSGGERGLLGIALHPSFPTDPRVFTDYTDVNGDTVVSSFTLAAADPSRFDPASERVILQVDQPFANHNGGGLVFGPDGFLYITLGDGGGGGDPEGNGQNLGALLAKILRIDIDHPATGTPYGIPSDNPFVGRAGARPEVWLYGLRNPWRIAFDRANGDLWIGDVGQNHWEEIDVVRAGEKGLNFGWNRLEGSHCYAPADGCDQNGVVMPITEYGRDAGCTVIGGYVYRGETYPLLRGGYLFADYCSGTFFAIPAAATSPTLPVALGETQGSVAAFGEDTNGELYVAALDGTISKVLASAR